MGLKRYELNGRKVLFYFDEVSLIQIPRLCVSQGIAHFCVNLVFIFTSVFLSFKIFFSVFVTL